MMSPSTLIPCERMKLRVQIPWSTEKSWVYFLGKGEYFRHGFEYTHEFTRFGDLKLTISFIYILLIICSTRLRFLVLLGHNFVYIVHKRELSVCVSFYSIPVFPEVFSRSHGFARSDATMTTLILALPLSATIKI